MTNTLKVRVTGKVAKFEFDSEDELFAKLADELTSQIDDTRGLGGINSPLRNYEAIELVHTPARGDRSPTGSSRSAAAGSTCAATDRSKAWLGGAVQSR